MVVAEAESGDWLSYETLRQIEIALGGNLPIQAFFDLMVGDKVRICLTCYHDPSGTIPDHYWPQTGGIVALGLGAMGWSVDTCIK